MYLIWEKSTLSGICDRLADMFLMLTLARIKDKKLVLIWEKYELKRIDPKFREHDYELQNLKKYIDIPNDVIFVDSIEEFQNYDGERFTRYLGGVFSIHTFYKKFCRNIPIESFITKYDTVISEFKPKLITNINDPYKKKNKR